VLDFEDLHAGSLSDRGPHPLQTVYVEDSPRRSYV